MSNAEMLVQLGTIRTKVHEMAENLEGRLFFVLPYLFPTTKHTGWLCLGFPNMVVWRYDAKYGRSERENKEKK